jgi:hypothetical protein
VKAPRELHPFHFLMAWHQRLNSDPRNVWLREAMRSTTAALHKSMQTESRIPFRSKDLDAVVLMNKLPTMPLLLAFDFARP